MLYTRICSRVALVEICQVLNPRVRFVAVEITGTAVQQVNASRLEVHHKITVLLQFVELIYLCRFNFPVIAWMAAARQKDKIFSASAARTHQDMANRIASSVNAAVVKIRQALLSSGYDEVGFIVCRLERDQCEISRDWWHKGIDPAESGNYRMGKSGKEFCSQAWAMSIKQSFSRRKSRQSLERCFGGIKKSYPCLLFESWDWVVGDPTE